MGRGKKKGDKKEEEPPKDPSSLSEQPSISAQPSSSTVEEEFEGLGLGGGRRKKKSKIIASKSESKVVEENVSEKPTEVPSKVEESKQEPKEEKPEAIDAESEGLGLGLSGAKKRIRKKKPGNVLPTTSAGIDSSSSAVGIVTSSSAVAPVASSSSVETIPLVPKLTQHIGPTNEPASSQPPWGQGRGRGFGRGQQQPKSHSAVTEPQQFPIITPKLSEPVIPSPAFQPDPVPSQPGFGRGRGQSPMISTPGPAQRPVTAPQFSQQPVKQVSTKDQSKAYGKEMPLCRYSIPSKIQGNSVRARPVKVLTNYLAMRFTKILKIHRYDVAFTPDKPKMFLTKVFLAVVKKYFPNESIAFDQMKNCYSLRALPNVSKTGDRIETSVEVTDMNGKQMKFDVAFKPTGIVDLSTIERYMKNGESSLCPPTEAIQCVDVILKQGTLDSYIKAGRQYFKRPSRPIDLGDGLEMWTGLFQSAIFTDRPFINIDVAHKGFPKEQFLTDALQNDFRLALDRPIEQQRGRGTENFLEFIKGLRVVAKVIGSGGADVQYRQYICNGIVEPPNKKTFTLTTSEGRKRTLTVAEYFLSEKKYRIKFPYLNCMWVGPKDKGIYYPIELLKVAYGQARNKQLNEMQLSTMVRMAATPPDDRKQKIDEVIREMNYSKNEFFRKFGFEIADQFFPVDARVLEPPCLEVGVQRTVMPRNGSWQANSLLKPEALISWGFIAIESDPNRCNFDNIIQLIMSTGRQMGMNVSAPGMHHFNVRINGLRPILFEALEKNINFLFIVISARGRDYYQRVKQLAERDVGILTQCIKEQTASNRMNQQTVRNILLKVNSKLMGINQALDGRSMPKCLKGGGVMVVGADVTHPSPDQSNIPSIAAVTASIDPKCYMYNIELSIQTPKREMIVEFEDMMVDHFNVYRKHNGGTLPRKIYVFRDGVSEGQFAQVLESELTAIHRAYQRLMGPNARPEVLFLLVQKRHHTRFFSTSNLKYNVEPGTVVDKHIVHAKELDFYLVSHQAIKGTARPTRYHAVCNDGAIPDDEVEQLTYYLCHLYSRCMRAVSYPTPTYYAHLACLRARSLTYGENFDNRELEVKPKRLRVLDRMLEKSRMFFV